MKPRLREGGIDLIVDPKLEGNYHRETYRAMADLALRCCDFEKKERPSMKVAHDWNLYPFQTCIVTPLLIQNLRDVEEDVSFLEWEKGFRVLCLTYEHTCDKQGVVAVLEPLLREAVPPETTTTDPWPGALWIRDAAGQPGTPGAYSTEGSIFTNSTTGSSSHRDSFTQSRTATNITANSTYLSAR